MIKKKLPEFKVGDNLRSGGWTFEITNIVNEPTITIKNLASGEKSVITSHELATYDHLSLRPRIGRPPRKAKPVVVETVDITDLNMSIDTALPMITNTPTITEQAPGPETASSLPIPPAGDTCPKVDPSTFELHVGGEGRQHKMTLAGKVTRGEDLKPTLLRLLERHGITGSDAEVETALVLFPDSQGRNLMIDILKGKKGG